MPSNSNYSRFERSVAYFWDVNFIEAADQTDPEYLNKMLTLWKG